MARPSKIITKEDIIRAQKVTRSNMAAARYLHISYNHYKKYAKMYKNEEGITLLQAHMNQAGEGIPKFAIAGIDNVPLMDVLEGRVPIEHFDPRKIKASAGWRLAVPAEWERNLPACFEKLRCRLISHCKTE